MLTLTITIDRFWLVVQFGANEMLKILSRIPPDRDFHIITESAPGQYSCCKIKIKELRDEIKPLNCSF